MKTLKSIMIAFVAILGMCLMTSCSKNAEASKVADKIESGAQLEQADYTVIIEYLGKYAEAVQPIQDNINNLPATDPKVADYEKEFDEVKSQYKYLEVFNAALEKASQSEVGADNVALVDKYAGYEWFNAPSWATIETDPEAAGIELEAPESDTTGVVAGAVDELQVKSGL